MFIKSFETNEMIINDPNTGYHDYFSAIYRIER